VPTVTTAPDAGPAPGASPPARRASRSGRRRRLSPGDLRALRRELWYALRRVGEVLDDPAAEPADLCRAGNTLAALANAYTRATEADDLAERVAALEQLTASRRP
jgi:hypothetical protein